MQAEKPSLEEIKRRQLTEKTLKSLELEGIYPSKKVLEDVELLDTGKISKEEFLERGFGRLRRKDNG